MLGLKLNHVSKRGLRYDDAEDDSGNDDVADDDEAPVLALEAARPLCKT